MAHLLLLGFCKGAVEDMATWLYAEHSVTLVRHPEALPRGEDYDLLLAAATDGDGLVAVAEAARRLAIPWLACCGLSDAGAATLCYRAGALAVLPLEAGAELVQRTVARLLASFGGLAGRTRGTPLSRPRQYRAGERIELEPESALEVLEGVLAVSVVHDDGAEVLLGFSGPQQVLTLDSREGCSFQVHAHENAKVFIQPWTAAAQRPGFADKLRDRLRSMEAWAAMQARPQIEQRLLGILSLLAEQFGRPSSRGTVIELRITHVQLAAAVGATRATVTRRLSRLRRGGYLTTTRSPHGERFCLRPTGRRHHSAAG